jgi:GH24 family phage-related lysozyme (muramidase)
VLDRWVNTGTTGFVAPRCKPDGRPPPTLPPPLPHPVPTPATCCKGINKAGIALIKKYAPFADNPVNDPAGRLKVGYGHVCSKTCKAPITPDEGTALLLEDIPEHAECLCGALDCAALSLSCNQWAALVSWTLDIGCGNMNDSVLVSRLNDGENVTAVLEMELPKWNKGGGREVPVLSLRRAAELKLALTPANKTVPAASQTAYPICGCL